MKFDGLANELGKAIEIIAEKMGVAAEKVYPILIQQVRVEVITDITINLLLIITTITLVKLVIKRYKGDWDMDILGFGLILPTCIVGMIAIMKTLAQINSIITGLLNPDWYIIEYMLMPLIN